MARSKHNHKRRITDRQPAKVKALYPGTIILFNYSGQKIFDREPMVLILWNDLGDKKIHGINLNYLTEFQIKQLFDKIMDGNTKSKKDDIPIIVEDQVAPNDYDDNLPYRNMLKDPYTRLKLPTYKEERKGNPLSKAEAKRQMEVLYERRLKKIVVKADIYRTYHHDKMVSTRVITYDIEGLLK
tara:strand:+ start:62 stop:613 length:552 start_codon:yes stop_codon:yes gene_type:complete